MTVRTIPPCVGYYEADDTSCNGDPRGETDLDKRACDWHPGCEAFWHHLEATGKTQGDYVQILEEPVLDNDGSPVTDEAGEPVLRETGRARDGGQAFYDFCARLASERETGPSPLVRPAQPRRRRGRKRTATTERGELRRRVRRGPYIGAARKREYMLERGEAIFEELIERIGPERRSKDRAAPTVGQVYVLLTGTGRPPSHVSYRRLTAYCRMGEGRDQPIMRLRPRRDGTFDVHLPVELETLAKALGAKGLAKVETPEWFELGQYRSRIKGVDEDGMEAVVRAVVALVRKGKIDLPALRGAE